MNGGAWYIVYALYDSLQMRC